MNLFCPRQLENIMQKIVTSASSILMLIKLMSCYNLCFFLGLNYRSVTKLRITHNPSPLLYPPTVNKVILFFSLLHQYFIGLPGTRHFQFMFIDVKRKENFIIFVNYSYKVVTRVIISRIQPHVNFSCKIENGNNARLFTLRS